MNEAALSAMPLEAAKSIKLGWYFRGINPPVPPFSGGILHRCTEVIVTPAAAATRVKPPKLAMIDAAGSHFMESLYEIRIKPVKYLNEIRIRNLNDLRCTIFV
jgi:hypothetical protein